jgi:hypothetical protein
MKHDPCAYCGKKPKVYKEPFNGEWHLDHYCQHLMGEAFMAGECKSDVVRAWNQRVADCRAAKPSHGSGPDGEGTECMSQLSGPVTNDPEIERLRAEVERLKLQIKHPQGGFCSYCGHHFEYGSEVGEEYRAKVVAHMAECEKAPFQRIMGPLMLILDWMHAQLPQMECRGDENCDHCYGLQLLKPFDEAFAASSEKGFQPKEQKDG